MQGAPVSCRVARQRGRATRIGSGWPCLRHASAASPSTVVRTSPAPTSAHLVRAARGSSSMRCACALDVRPKVRSARRSAGTDGDDVAPSVAVRVGGCAIRVSLGTTSSRSGYTAASSAPRGSAARAKTGPAGRRPHHANGQGAWRVVVSSLALHGPLGIVVAIDRLARAEPARSSLITTRTLRAQVLPARGRSGPAPHAFRCLVQPATPRGSIQTVRAYAAR